MSDYLFLPADANIFAGRTVTSTAGTPDSDHPVAWLTDLRPAFPIRYPSGAWGVSVSVATKSVQLVVLANHSLDAAVTVGGGVSGTITPSAARPDGSYLNPFLYLGSAVAGVTSITLAGTNTAAMILGEAFAGVPIAITPFQMRDMHDELFAGGDEGLLGDYLNIPPYDEAREWRVFGGTQVFTTSERTALENAFLAQRGYSRPGVLIIDRTANDARVVLLMRPTFKPADHPSLWETSLVFLEYPRYRW